MFINAIILFFLEIIFFFGMISLFYQDKKFINYQYIIILLLLLLLLLLLQLLVGLISKIIQHAVIAAYNRPQKVNHIIIIQKAYFELQINLAHQQKTGPNKIRCNRGERKG